MPIIDLTGQRFGKLTVIRFDKVRKEKRYWECLCDCGKTVTTSTDHLRNRVKSCGYCDRKGNRTHGLSRKYKREYEAWTHIRARCYNKKSPDFKNYGERGIVLSYDWYASFEDFLSDMGPRPSAKHTIERRDNDGPYSRENAYWATRTEQARNKRDNINLTFNGRTMCLREWARELNLHYKALWNRLMRLHWPVEKALSIPTVKRDH